MLENKRKRVLIVVGLLICCFLVIGVSYAVWQMTLVQTDSNVVTTGCFKVEFTDQNPIILDKAYPMSDEDGKSNTPYEFTLTNTCDSEATYYINLETITSATKKLSEEHLKASLKKGDEEVFLSTLNSSYVNLDKVLSEASNAYKLYQGKLTSNEEVTFHLNLWLDENTSATDEVMNATYEGKITVLTSYKPPTNKKGMMKAMGVDDSRLGHCNSGGCEMPISNTLYTNEGKYNNQLNKVIYQSVKNPLTNAEEVVDFSEAQDGSVLGYYVKEENDLYTLYIQSNGKVKINSVATNFSLIDTSVDVDPRIEGLENIDTSAVTDISYMFYYMDYLTSLDLRMFDLSSITKTSHMFAGLDGLTSIDLTPLDTSNVTDMSYMFSGLRNITALDISTLKTNKVTNMSGMFSGLSLQKLDLSPLDTTNVTDMSYMFSGLSSVEPLDLSPLKTSKVTNMSGMFSGLNLQSLDLSPLDTSNVTDMSYMFSRLNNLLTLDLSPLNTSNVTNMSHMFSQLNCLTALDLSSFNTSKVTNMSSMFLNSNLLTSLNLNGLNTSNVTNMRYMFSGVSNLTSLDLSSFDTRNVTDMSNMFWHYIVSYEQSKSQLEEIVFSAKFNTQNVINMEGMFYGLAKLASLDLSSFNTNNVENMNRMFWENNSISSLDLSNFETSNLKYMANMFRGMTSLTNLNISNFNTSKVKDMNGVFSKLTSLTTLNLNSFDTHNVESFGSPVVDLWNNGMFQESKNLTNITYGDNFVYNNNAQTHGMFYNCPANKPTHESWNDLFP